MVIVALFFHDTSTIFDIIRWRLSRFFRWFSHNDDEKKHTVALSKLWRTLDPKSCTMWQELSAGFIHKFTHYTSSHDNYNLKTVTLSGKKIFEKEK